ncbi:MAG TPA: MAPEG family protein [Rhizomicrobium sp.]|nr:MAPEG family protein [Rhizomicrobium sp.]
MIASPATLLTAIVTVLAVLVYYWTILGVGRMRGKHDIKAPATTGNPEFECAYRVQMNTLEQMVVFLPLLWVANAYFQLYPYLVGAFGLVWIVGRVMYAVGYMADPSKRSTGFLVSAVALIALLIMAIVGLVQAYLALAAS